MFLISTLYITLSLILVLTIPVSNGSTQRPTRVMKEGDACPTDTKFPKSICQLPDNCATLPAYIDAKLISLDDIPSCGFLNAFNSEMLCCPLQMPGQTIPKLKERPIINDKKSFTHLVTLSYLKPDTLDDFVDRCTAIILSPSHVLASSICVGRKIVYKPIHVRFGIYNSDDYDDDAVEIEIKRTTSVSSGLALFELDRELNADDVDKSKVSAAILCLKTDLEGSPKLHVAAYSQHADGTNCKLFVSQLVTHDNCSTVQNERRVEGLNATDSHICVKPVWDNYDNSECTKCLTASSSVLHVKRDDGSYCVAGIATPTTDKCIVNDYPLYFTSIVSGATGTSIGRYGSTGATFRG